MLEGDADLGLERFASGDRPALRFLEDFGREFLDECHGLVFGEIATRELASAIFCAFYLPNKFNLLAGFFARQPCFFEILWPLGRPPPNCLLR